MRRLWECSDCGEKFDEPIVNERMEDMNGEGAWFRWIEYHCPFCGSEEIEWDFVEAENAGTDSL